MQLVQINIISVNYSPEHNSVYKNNTHEFELKNITSLNEILDFKAKTIRIFAFKI